MSNVRVNTIKYNSIIPEKHIKKKHSSIFSHADKQDNLKPSC